MRRWTVLAQDPSDRANQGHALTTTVSIPAERLERGLHGQRVHIVDYGVSSNRFCDSRSGNLETERIRTFISRTSMRLLQRRCTRSNAHSDVPSTVAPPPRRTRSRAAPHAFEDANASHSRDCECESPKFGDLPDDSGKRNFTGLSRGSVVHETIHALLDGLRPMYLESS